MKNIIFFSILFFSFLFANASHSAPDVKIYLPGDVVHVVVGAPPDTEQILSEMPDGKRVKLAFNRRTHIWEGHWEVPYGFRKGTYTAKLIATDISGRAFEGLTSAFVIGESALVTVIKVAPQNGDEEKKQAEAAAKPETEAMLPKETEQKMLRPVRAPKKEAKAPVRPAPRPKVKKPKPMSEMAIAMMRMRLMRSAKTYVANEEYIKAHAELKALLKIDPGNTEVKKLLGRLTAAINASGKKE